MTDTSFDITAQSQAEPRPQEVRDYIALLKPRVMSLVVFTGFAGLLVAPGEIHPFLGAVAILCIAIASGAAGAINMWYDRDIDAIMSRTQSRPIPQGRIEASEALAFGIVLTLFSVVLMGLAINWMAAFLLAFASLFYVLVYTMWLKRSTPHNIVIGGAAGAFPPMIGWAAVTGSVELASVMLFGLIFMWTPPHFWALALFRQGDYAKAKVPMLPVVAGKRHTKWQMLIYTLALIPIAAAPSFLGVAGVLYGISSLVVSGLFVLCAVRVLRSEDDKPAKQMFGFSILYLFLLFALMIVDRAPGLAGMMPVGLGG